MIKVPATNQYNIALPGKQQHIAINIFPPLFGQAASSYYRLPWLAFNNFQPFCSTLQNPQWKAWLKRRGKERKSPHGNITYYLYSLWKTGLKHRILICQKKKLVHTNTHFFIIIQDKQKLKKTNKKGHTFWAHKNFLNRWGSLSCFHSCQWLTCSLSTGFLAHTLTPHPSHQQLITTSLYIATIKLETPLVSQSHHLHIIISHMMLMIQIYS